MTRSVVGALQSGGSPRGAWGKGEGWGASAWELGGIGSWATSLAVSMPSVFPKGWGPRWAAWRREKLPLLLPPTRICGQLGSWDRRAPFQGTFWDTSTLG